jgi:hypothetical protein
MGGRTASAISKLKKQGMAQIEEGSPKESKGRPAPRCGCGSSVGVALRERLNPRNLREETAVLCAECGGRDGWKKKSLGRVEGVTGEDAPAGRAWEAARSEALGLDYDERKELNEERGYDI